MGILYDDDFQSYALAATPPYGNLVQLGVAPPRISNVIPGVFGDAKCVDTPGVVCLQWPNATPTVSDPAYASLSIFQTLQYDVGTGTDQQGTLITFSSNFSLSVAGIMAFLFAFSDGTLGFANFGQVPIVSDFAFLRGGWYTLQTNVTFFNAAGFLACDFEVAVNGISVLKGIQGSTRTIASMPVLYINNISFGAAGGRMFLGRMTIFDSIQPIGSVPHPGSPEARISQGVIELVISPDKWRVYEA